MKQALKLGQVLGQGLGKQVLKKQAFGENGFGKAGERKRAGSRAAAQGSNGTSGLEARLTDEAHFLRNWVDAPGRIGAVSPSGRFLARAMARSIDPNGTGLVVELGPGTGPVTEALLERGVAPERLILVEYEAAFCGLLRRRFPGLRVVQGDAYGLRATLDGVVEGPVAAIVSSLPLLNRPDEDRRALLEQAFELMGPDGQFVQFTYGLTSPIPLRPAAGRQPGFIADVDKPVWLNLPPARVWRYRRADHYARSIDMEPLPFERMPLLDALNQKQVAPALALIRKLADGGAMRR